VGSFRAFCRRFVRDHSAGVVIFFLFFFFLEEDEFGDVNDKTQAAFPLDKSALQRKRPRWCKIRTAHNFLLFSFSRLK